MAAPTFVQEAEVSFGTTANAATTGTFDALAGDVLVAVGISEDASYPITITNNGAALTWTEQQQVNVASYTRVYIWTTVLAGDRTGLTVTFTTVSFGMHGGNVLTYRGSDGVGASNKTNVSGAAPSLGLTTAQDNSAIIIANGDWNAADGTTRTWRTVNGSAATEQSYLRDSAHYSAYVGRHIDAGTAGAKTVGLSAPSGQKYSIAAVEVKGSASGSQTITPGHLAPGAQLFAPTLAPGSVTITPGAIAAAAQVFAPTLAQVVTPGFVASTAQLFAPTLAPGSVTIQPGHLASTEQVFAPTVDGSIIVTPGFISSAAQVFAPSLAVGSVAVSPGFIASGAQVFQPSLAGGDAPAAATGQRPTLGVG